MPTKVSVAKVFIVFAAEIFSSALAASCCITGRELFLNWFRIRFKPNPRMPRNFPREHCEVAHWLSSLQAITGPWVDCAPFSDDERNLLSHVRAPFFFCSCTPTTLAKLGFFVNRAQATELRVHYFEREGKADERP